MPSEQTETTGQLVQLLSELALALYATAPHGETGCRAPGEPLTTRQMEAIILLAHRREATLSELADGLGIGAAAASELVARLCEKGVVNRRRSAADARLVHLSLAEPAERRAQEILMRWGAHLDGVFAASPDIAADSLIAFLRALIDSLKGRPPA